ncbi:Imm70 family immunity protein (plasmid) [Clostridium perfringens]
MAVGLKIDFLWYQIGIPDFLHSFFSTISYNLEESKWGSKYPILMNELYQGKLSWENANKAIKELNLIRKELKKFSPDYVVWDIDDISKLSPWGKNISSDITDLSNYFVTSEKRFDRCNYNGIE